MDDTKPLVIFGANGAVGRHAVSLAAERGMAVRAVEYSWPDDADLPAGAERRTADVTGDDLAPILDGARAVLSCVGLPLTVRTAFDPPPLYTEGTKRYLEAMEATGVRRIVVISASFVATRDRGPWLFRAVATVALESIFSQMGEMERQLRASDTDWTAVRPGWLLSGERSGKAQVTPEVIAPGLIRTRHADLAEFMLDCVVEGDWIHRTPAIAAPEPRRAESAHRLLLEIAP